MTDALKGAGSGEWERSYLISCPWCGEEMRGQPMSYTIPHLIRHGDAARGEVAALTQRLETQAVLIGDYPDPRDTIEHLTQRAERAEAKAREECTRVWKLYDLERAARQRVEDSVTELHAALRELGIDANRLCDRNLGGTYEADCRRSIAKADVAMEAARLGRFPALEAALIEEGK